MKFLGRRLVAVAHSMHTANPAGTDRHDASLDATSQKKASRRNGVRKLRTIRGCIAALAAITVAEMAQADPITITETGIITRAQNFDRSASPLQNQPYTLTMNFDSSDFVHGIHPACSTLTSQCYYFDKFPQTEGSTVFSAGGITGSIPNSGLAYAGFDQQTANGFGTLRTQSGTIGSDFLSSITSAASNIPDPFASKVSNVSIPVTGTFGNTQPYFLYIYNSAFGSLNILTGTVTNVTINSTSVTPPTPLELAAMSQQTYTIGPPSAIDTYVPIEVTQGRAGFGAQAYRSGDNIVLAIRGTNRNNERDKLKNLEADYAFTTNAVNVELSTEVDEAASLLKSLQAQCPTCNFYLTGHSLGGALVQILSSATGLPTLAFNAPGAGGQVLQKLQTNLTSLRSISFANSGGNENLRMYGDLISQEGASLGTQVTIDSFHNTKADIDPLLVWQKNHSISEMVHALAKGNVQTPGVLGPILSEAQEWIAGKYLRKNHYEFDLQVKQGKITPLDPPSGDFYRLVENEGTPFFETIALPFEPDIASYELSFLHAGVWSPDTLIAPGEFYQFEPEVYGIAFLGLDDRGIASGMPGQFVFDVTFASDGKFVGVLTTASDVPESATWALFAAAACLVLQTIGFRRAGTKS